MAIDVNSLSTGAGGPVDNSHPPKRTKLDDWNANLSRKDSLTQPLSVHHRTFLKSLAPTLKLKHDQSIPYRHAVLNNIFDENLLRKARDEIRNGLSFSLKETDIYKTDMSSNYRQGCHLLNHDDVIGTRRVFIFLDSETRQPLPTTPSSKILPSWNHFVFFVVQPGKSFHSVEEVFNSKKSRLSISGWFHLPHEDESGYLDGLRIKEEEEKQLESLGASLDQLKGKCGDDSLWVDTGFQVLTEATSTLTTSDIQYLSEFIDPSFLKIADISSSRIGL
ncbi:hypothetical protein KEM48_011094 [Puccinia striiformis f. sp. tritici PST-130]|nr:hypothetical protein KEM48_011094 [Puccinia striiformis f. sp. tritici PST-130]